MGDSADYAAKAETQEAFIWKDRLRMVHYATVWYAAPERAASRSKFRGYDDRGSLDISSSGLIFIGGKQRLPMGDIRAVTWTRHSIPWVTYMLAQVFMSWCYVLFYYVMQPDLAELTTFRVEVSLILIAVAVLGSTLVAVLIHVNTPWVLVEYLDVSNQVRQAYFKDASGFGWGGILGGTWRMYQAILPLCREQSVSAKGIG
jgi:hypothetical protein